MIPEQEVYNVLTYRWQTTLEIRSKIADDRGKNKFKISIAIIHSRLDSLVAQGFAEVNEREPIKEEAVRRGENRVREYKKIGEKEYYEKPGEVEDLGLATA